MRIGYVTTYDARDRLNWSGVAHGIMGSLHGAGADVLPLGPLQTDLKLLGRVFGRIYRQQFNRMLDFEREAIPTCGYARQVIAKLKDDPCDVVLSPTTMPVCRLSCRQPIVIWTDATFASYIKHYGLEPIYSERSIRAGHRSERLAFDRASLLIFASEWAAQSAVSDYRVDPAKVKVIPFGANFIDPPTRQVVQASIERRTFDRCRLITMGVDWQRKGITRAIELAGLLNRRGTPTTLDVVGVQPPDGAPVPEFVNLVGFIDKRTAAGERQIGSLLLRSHFHILFSVAEAFGVVFAEANAHGVPNIANDIGGVSSAVRNEFGGHRFSLATPLETIAQYIEIHLQDRRRYVDAARRARGEFDERLNWRSAGSLAMQYIGEACAKGPALRQAAVSGKKVPVQQSRECEDPS
jgi:glycosyltransferase involved in cell wall biosynthesis